MNHRTNISFTTIMAACALGSFLPVSAVAQSVPGTIGFSARLTDSDGPVDALVDVQFRLFDAPSDGAKVWEESHEGAVVAGGLMHAALGSVPENELDAAVFDGRTLYLEVEVDGDVLSPRVALMSVPYALRAASAAHAETATSAQTLDGLTADDLTYEAGEGLAMIDNVLSVKFGDSGTGESAARADHAHTISCTSRHSAVTQLEANTVGTATATCQDGETLTGGSCWGGIGGIGSHLYASMVRSAETGGNGWTCIYSYRPPASGGYWFSARARCCTIE